MFLKIYVTSSQTVVLAGGSFMPYNIVEIYLLTMLRVRRCHNIIKSHRCIMLYLRSVSAGKLVVLNQIMNLYLLFHSYLTLHLSEFVRMMTS